MGCQLHEGNERNSTRLIVRGREKDEQRSCETECFFFHPPALLRLGKNIEDLLVFSTEFSEDSPNSDLLGKKIAFPTVFYHA